MKKWISRLVWAALALIVVAFLTANRQPVSISLDPFSQDAPAIATPAFPLWFWLMAAIFIGVGAGAAGMWASGRPARRKARAERRELKALKKDLERVMKDAAPKNPDPPMTEISDQK
ncbi:MAG: lipopolysaccharide assembly protein LapA domain-containing protein [Parvularculaceae bacterium]